MMRIKFHSVVDVITNSSTVIYTYQNSVKEAKELVNEIMKIAGFGGSADDAFYYGVFYEDFYYEEWYADWVGGNEEYEGYPSDYKKRSAWYEELFLKIMKGEVEEPGWFNKDFGYDDLSPDSYLHLAPKNEKYKDLGDKIKALLSSVNADGGRDG